VRATKPAADCESERRKLEDRSRFRLLFCLAQRDFEGDEPGGGKQAPPHPGNGGLFGAAERALNQPEQHVARHEAVAVVLAGDAKGIGVLLTALIERLRAFAVNNDQPAELLALL